jgi:hypothetical protein
MPNSGKPEFGWQKPYRAEYFDAAWGKRPARMNLLLRRRD